MENHVALMEITIVFLAALLCGLLLRQLRQPPLVGYILAGLILGPSVLGLVDNESAIRILAELGAMLLMFVIGMELSLRAFRRMYKLTLSVVALQVLLGLAAAFALGALFDWPSTTSLIVGFAVALSSTAVGVNMLEDIGELRTSMGSLTVGILIAQDLAVVPMFVIAENIHGKTFLDPLLLLRVFGAIAFLAWFVPFISRRKRMSLPFAPQNGHDSGVTVLAGLTFCFLLATISGLLGLTAALGAFIAGLTIASTQQRKEFMEATLPIRDILLMLFFLSVGLSIDIGFIKGHLLELALLVVFAMILKTIANLLILRLLRQPLIRSIKAASMLAQIGEFSFILGATGLAAGALSYEAYRLLVTTIALTLIASPLWLASARELSNARYLIILTECVTSPMSLWRRWKKRHHTEHGEEAAGQAPG